MTIVPEYLYRVFDEEKIANDFIQLGKIWIFSAAKYRYLDDECRKDSKEGSADYRCLVPELSSTPALVNERVANQFYVFSSAGPDADLEYIKRFGKFIVKINSPLNLLEDLAKFKPQHICSCVLKPVDYNENRFVEERDHWISMTQKNKGYRNDCEYRYILESRSLRNYDYQDCLDGGWDFKQTNGQSRMPAYQTLHIELDFKGPPSYLEKIW